MSNNLDLDQMTEGQDAPEVTHNDSNAQLDAAVTETVTIDGTTDVTISDSDWRRHVHVIVDNVTDAARIITVPGIKKLMLIEGAGSNSALFTLKRGSGSVAVSPGDKFVVYCDGSTNGLASFGGGSGGGGGSATLETALSQFVPGVVTASAIVFQYVATEEVDLPSGLAGSYAHAATASTGTVTYVIKINGSTVGSVAFTTSATGVYTFLADETLAVGDVLTITAPGGSPDATLKDVTFAFKASNTGTGGGGGGGADIHVPDLTLFSTTANGTGVTQANTFAADFGLCLTRTDTGTGGSERAAFLGKNVPASTPWTATARIKGSIQPSSYLRYGLAVYDGTKLTVLAIHNFNGSSLSVALMRFTDLDTFNTTTAFQDFTPGTPYPEWFRINFDGTNYTFQISLTNSLSWLTIGTLAAAAIGTATKIGLAVESFGAITANWGNATLLYYDDPDFPA